MGQPPQLHVEGGVSPYYGTLADLSAPAAHAAIAPQRRGRGEVGQGATGAAGRDAADVDDDLMAGAAGGGDQALEVADGGRVGDAVGQRLALVDLDGAVGGGLAGQRVGRLLVVQTGGQEQAVKPRGATDDRGALRDGAQVREGQEAGGGELKPGYRGLRPIRKRSFPDRLDM